MLSWRGQSAPDIAENRRGADDEKPAKKGIDPLPYRHGELAAKLSKLKSTSGLSDAKLAIKLEGVVGIKISPSTIWGWRNGRSLPGRGNETLIKAVISGISELENNVTLFEDGAWLSPSEMQATIEQWQRDLKGISAKPLAAMLGVPYTTMLRWVDGQYYVPRHRIDALQKKVDEAAS